MEAWACYRTLAHTGSSVLAALTLGVYHHRFVCFTGSDGKQACRGLGPANPGATGPGVVEEDKMSNGLCVQVPDENNCVSRCMEKKTSEPAPNYNVMNFNGRRGTANCQSYARNIVNDCVASCSAAK